MSESSGDYRDWATIEYLPALQMMPDLLVPHLPPGGHVLDIGCNTGTVALYLAERGVRVTGVDLNPDAVAEATRRSAARGLGHLTDFQARDATHAWGDADGAFDAVLMIRVLTCFPAETGWELVQRRAFEAVRRGEGLLYVNDFLMNDASPVYRDRYSAGARRGWRRGNFEVLGADGARQFVAHHHTLPEVERVARPYQKLAMRVRESLSLNGNPCMMFEFIGRKLEP